MMKKLNFKSNNLMKNQFNSISKKKNLRCIKNKFLNKKKNNKIKIQILMKI